MVLSRKTLGDPVQPTALTTPKPVSSGKHGALNVARLSADSGLAHPARVADHQTLALHPIH